LPEGEVHVWRCNVPGSDEATAALLTGLDDAETVRAGTFRAAADRRRYVAGRAALRALAADYTGTAPAELRFGAGARGKPALVAPVGASGLRFNISHATDLVLLAFARGLEVGIDVERVNRDVDWRGIAGRFFADEESAALLALPAARRCRAFLVRWSCAEAVAKARGDGVLRALAGASRPARRGLAPVAVTAAGGGWGEEWVLHRLVPAAGYVGALAYPAPPLQVRRFGLP
jgi:4'-phosphopantetheinyl transferase